jgi:hypothetical protein
LYWSITFIFFADGWSNFGVVVVIINRKRKDYMVTINPFAPVVDGKFLNDTPQNILNGKGMALMFYRSLDMMIGNCDAEGSILVDNNSEP